MPDLHEKSELVRHSPLTFLRLKFTLSVEDTRTIFFVKA